ncbi:hypothetical protein GCM10017778_03440 [Streptomyces vinaceus]|nr:hypothetical protein GCM10017778_03440 [Streptomyces vinaceus]
MVLDRLARRAQPVPVGQLGDGPGPFVADGVGGAAEVGAEHRVPHGLPGRIRESRKVWKGWSGWKLWSVWTV